MALHFQLFIAVDGTEISLRAHDSRPEIDVEGREMLLTAEYAARNWDEACGTRNAILGWEEYNPFRPTRSRRRRTGGR